MKPHLKQTGPLIAALAKRLQRRDVSFHVPGHKMGRAVYEPLRRLIAETAFEVDYTELPGLDNLSCPCDVLAESQAMTAEMFGADHSFYLINGTTVGIHAAMLATCPVGTICLMARNSHVSTFNAVQLAGCTPQYLIPEVDAEHGICHGVAVEELQKALSRLQAQDLAVGAVFIVSPTYFGAANDVQGLAEVCHSFGVPLIVDGAHGAHFKFHKAFPADALSCGADVVIHSTHKTLTSLTQSSMLHIKSTIVSAERIAKWLRILQASTDL